ncbi:MAG TPA: hypothetical protein VGR26_00535, partial [Acidimicrobiales bacterium]|nr:hypothetical protein [Acidimicrobiales bacterium]
MSRVAAEPERPWWRSEGSRFVEILALAGFAVAQPVLGSFGDSPETFVAADASARTIVAFGVAVALVPAVVLWALAAATGVVGPRVRQAAQSVAVGLLVGLFASWSTRQLLPGSAWKVVAALAAGLAAAFLYDRFASARLYLAFASVAPVVFLVVFLAFSPVSNLVFTPQPEPAVAPSGQPSNQPSVVMVVLDELPTLSLLDGRDRVDAALFPNFARFADDATFYRNTTTVSPITDVALPALVTGRIRPEANAVREDYVENLFTLLGDSHQLNVHEAITSLCPPSRCNQSFDAKAIGRLGYRAWDLWTGIVSSSPATSVGEGAGEDTFEAFMELLAGRFEQVDAFVASLEPEA